MTIEHMRRLGAVLLLLPLAATAASGADQSAVRRASVLADVHSWHYQLQNVRVSELEKSAADLVVVDIAKQEGLELTPEQIERLHMKPDGSRRVVLAYLSIGEAEDYRDYWQAEWRRQPPKWLVAENCRWQGNHIVRFWDDEWKRIIYAGEESYLELIQSMGFDGVYLDRIDVWDGLQGERADARAQMIAFVRKLADAARERDPEFLVVAQNAEELLTSREYRQIIDGIAKEDLLYGLAGDGRRNAPDEIKDAAEYLALMQRDRKAVLAVEYLVTADLAFAARQEHLKLGFVPTFAPRDLDAPSPFAIPETNIATMPNKVRAEVAQGRDRSLAGSAVVPCRSN